MTKERLPYNCVNPDKIVEMQESCCVPSDCTFCSVKVSIGINESKLLSTTVTSSGERSWKRETETNIGDREKQIHERPYLYLKEQAEWNT